MERLDLNDTPDLVVIQVYITSAYRAYRLADHYRRRGAHVALGGLHVTSLPEEAARACGHDLSRARRGYLAAISRRFQARPPGARLSVRGPHARRHSADPPRSHQAAISISSRTPSSCRAAVRMSATSVTRRRSSKAAGPSIPRPSMPRSPRSSVCRDVICTFSTTTCSGRLALMQGVPPVATTPPPSRVSFPFNQRWALAAWDWLFAPSGTFTPIAGRDAGWNRGAYLVQSLGHCGSCHTPRGAAYQERGYDESSKEYLAGGINDNWYALNLRGDPGSGLGRVSRDDIASFLKSGHGGGMVTFGSMVQTVEDSLQYLSDDDLRAMATYLKTLSATGAADGNSWSTTRSPRSRLVHQTYRLQSARRFMRRFARSVIGRAEKASPTRFRS